MSIRKSVAVVAVFAAIGLAPIAYAADGWGIAGEKVVRYEAKVVDLLCELTGDCPANCGDGKRQLGLLKEDGTLWPVVKNNDPFAGATVDLISFCGKKIVADGLEIHNPKMKLFQLQYKRLAPDGKWSQANWFTKDWAKRNGKEDGSGWIWEDKTIQALIEKDGVLGVPGMKPPKE